MPGALNVVGLLAGRRAGSISPLQLQARLVGHHTRGLKLSEGSELSQESHTAAVTSLALDSEEERYLLAGLGDGTLCIHDVYGTRKKCGYKSKLELRIGRNSSYSHTHSIQTVSWFNDNGMFLSSGRDGKLKVWDSNQGVVVEEFTVGSVINKHAVAGAEVGPLVAVANDTNHLHLVDLNTGSTCHTLRGHEGEVLICAWSKANPRILASGAQDNKIIIWDVRQSRSYLTSLDYNNVRYKRKRDIKLAGQSHQAGVHGLEFTTCGRFLLSLGKDKRIRKWDTMTYKNLKTKFPEVETKCKGSVDLVTSQGGDVEYLFLPEHNNIAVFNIDSGSREAPLIGHYSGVYCLTWSWARLTVYSGARDRFILQWDTQINNDAATLSKVVETAEKNINPYTVDTWSSDEDQE